MAPYREVFCRAEGFDHVSRYVTGLLLSPNKTLQGIYEGLHKDSCKSGHRTRMEILRHLIRAVFGELILPMARLIRAVGRDHIG